MKSMLQEASSIAKAVEKAWEAAGKPEEFTIKVLDQGERGFLGLTTVKPAIVSIIYEPGKSSRRPASSSPRPNNRSSHQGRDGRESLKHASAEDVLRKDDQQQRRNQQPRKAQPERQATGDKQPERQPRPQPQPRREQNQQEGPQAERQASPRQLEGQPYWNAELMGDIESNLKEILAIMGVGSSFALSFEKQLLTINFAESTVHEAEAEKMLYTSVSYLLLQFLKKKHRRRFKGYRILMVSPTCGNAPIEKDED